MTVLAPHDVAIVAQSIARMGESVFADLECLRAVTVAALTEDPSRRGLGPLEPLISRTVVMRDGRRLLVTVVPITQEQMRRGQLQRGGRAAVLAINGYLSIPLHVWMVLLPAMLLFLRPGHKDASLAALALASWAGAFSSEQGLVRRHNTRAFLLALHATASNSDDPGVRRLLGAVLAVLLTSACAVQGSASPVAPPTSPVARE